MPARTHGHGGVKTSPTYNSWRAMIARCWHPARRDFKWYGGRGIQVDPAWLVPPRGTGGFEQFVADLGERPDGHTLDRIDVNGHYTPGNCRWITVAEQNHPSRRQPGGYTIVEDADELAYRVSRGEVDLDAYRVPPLWPDLVVPVPVGVSVDLPF